MLSEEGLKNLKDEIRKEILTETTKSSKFVLVRTYSAGVHFGYLKSIEGTAMAPAPALATATAVALAIAVALALETATAVAMATVLALALAMATVSVPAWGLVLAEPAV